MPDAPPELRIPLDDELRRRTQQISDALEETMRRTLLVEVLGQASAARESIAAYLAAADLVQKVLGLCVSAGIPADAARAAAEQVLLSDKEVEAAAAAQASKPGELAAQLLVPEFPARSRRAVEGHAKFLERMGSGQDIWAELASWADVGQDGIALRRAAHGDLLVGRLLWAMGLALREVHELSRSEAREIGLQHALRWERALKARWETLAAGVLRA